MERISSRQNALVKRFRDVAAGQAAGEWMLLDGEHLLGEALASGLHIDVVALAERVSTGPLAGLAAELERKGVRVVTTTSDAMIAASPVKHPSGVVAIARQPAWTLDQVLHARPAMVLFVAGVQDPGNVGAIVRAAEGCGATGLVATLGTADPFGWKALRGGMGSTFRLPIATKQPLEAAVNRARAAGLRVIAATARGGTPLPACDLGGDCAVLLGSEGAGLPEALVDAADARVTIPMRAPVESLNVAIAAALVLYEAARQRTPSLARSPNVAV